MSKNIINLEINEVSPSLISDYIRKNKKSNLAQLLNKEYLKIYSTDEFDKIINQYVEKKGYINYLNYSKLITEYF